jgi:hypothetical protein
MDKSGAFQVASWTTSSFAAAAALAKLRDKTRLLD